MTYRKLIEVALPLEDINREAAREKSIQHGQQSSPMRPSCRSEKVHIRPDLAR